MDLKINKLPPGPTKIELDLAEFNFSTQDSRAKELLTTFLELMKDFTNGSYETKQFTRAKDRARVKYIESCPNTAFLGPFYGFQLIYRDISDVDTPTDVLQKTEKVTKTEIKRISRKIFNPNNMIVVYQSKKSFKC